MSTSLYVAKKSLCKVLLEYIYQLNNLIRSTRNILNEHLSLLFEGLQSDKMRNSKTLDDLVLTAIEFMYDINTNPTDACSPNDDYDQVYNIMKPAASIILKLTLFSCDS